MENREIKFRGKSIYDGSWAYGYYFYDENKDRHFIINLTPAGAMQETKIKPETLGQYTGQKDNNETKIYNGDFIKYLGLTFVVRLDRYGVLFNDPNNEKEHWNRLLPFSFSGELPEHYIIDTGNYEVIGNEFDNPELLNKDK